MPADPAAPAGAAATPDVPTVGPPAPDLAAAGLPATGAGGTGLPERPAAPPVPPIVAQVDRESAALEALGQRVIEERDTYATLAADSATAAAAWADASDRYVLDERHTEEWARDSYLLAAETGSPLPGPVADVAHSQNLLPGTLLGPDEARRLGAETAASGRDIVETTQAYAEARDAADAAGATVGTLEAELTRRTAALIALKVAHRAELAAARISTDTYDAALSRRYLSGLELTGRTASPIALKAVRFALAQLGKPYVWGAEGPDTYDCSGLVQTAYAYAGLRLPRTARPQYLVTTPVPVSAMIPGDLLFFGPDPANWNSIHHVGIYLGDGLMVHAPTTGDVVRVAPVWWAEFFGATRVVGALPGGAQAATVAPPVTVRPPVPAPSAGPGSPSGSPAPSPTTGPPPSPSPKPAPSPTVGPPSTPSPTGSPSGSPSGSPTPSPTCPAPSPSGSPSPTASPGPSASPGPGCPPSPTPTSTASPSAAGSP
jgi:cell wall-associated NlpC family hydrolase